MKKILTVALCAASMMFASCATMPTTATGKAAQIGASVGRAQAAYDRIAAAAEILLPYLSPDRAARIRQATAVAERGLIAARYAATAAEQLATLKQVEAATSVIETTAGS
jgi:hypothetical protein